MKALFCIGLLAVACGGHSASPASAPASAPANETQSAERTDGGASDCPGALNCQPPTNDESPLCRLPPAELKKRCPNTNVLE